MMTTFVGVTCQYATISCIVAPEAIHKVPKILCGFCATWVAQRETQKTVNAILT